MLNNPQPYQVRNYCTMMKSVIWMTTETTYFLELFYRKKMFWKELNEITFRILGGLKITCLLRSRLKKTTEILILSIPKSKYQYQNLNLFIPKRRFQNIFSRLVIPNLLLCCLVKTLPMPKKCVPKNQNVWSINLTWRSLPIKPGVATHLCVEKILQYVAKKL